VSEEIKLTKRPFKEQVEYLLTKGLAESGAVTRACLTSLACVAQNESDSLKSILQERESDFLHEVEIRKLREDQLVIQSESLIKATERIATLEGILKDRDGIIADLLADLKKVVDAGCGQLIEPRRIDLKSYAARPEAGEIRNMTTYSKEPKRDQPCPVHGKYDSCQGH